MNTLPEIPIWKSFDVIVAGGRTPGVAAALELARNGKSVLFTTPLSYPGEDVTGAWNFWPEQPADGSSELASALFGDWFGSGAPLLPLEAKRRIEALLLDAGVELLYGCYAVAGLESEEGIATGVVLGQRGGLFGVEAKIIVDASGFATAARLFGVSTRAPEGNCTISLTATIRGEDPLAPQGVAVSVREDSVWAGKDGDAKVFVISKEYEYAADPSWLSSCEADLRLACYDVGASAIAEVPVIDQCPTLREASRWSGEAISDFEPLLLEQGRVAILDRSGYAMSEARRQFDHGPSAVRIGEAAGRILTERLETASGYRSARMRSGESRNAGLSFEVPFLRDGSINQISAADVWSVQANVEVFVAGGGTGGAPAGIAAAREGAKTLVCESQHALGGVGTVGMISSYYFGNRCGFTSEMDRGVAQIENRDDPDAKRWDPEAKKLWLLRELLAAGGRVLFGATVAAVTRQGDRLTGALVCLPEGAFWCRFQNVVDATGSADLVAAAGAECVTIGAGHVARQGVGLTSWAPGETYRNSDWSFCEDTDPWDRTAMFIAGRQKFRGAFDLSTFIDSRERRRIVGRAELTAIDFFSGRQYPDTVATAHSNFDTHGFVVDPLFLLAPPSKTGMSVDVPFRAMLPIELENVLVTGLGMSAERDAFPVIRMQADVQNYGYVAGIASTWAAARGEGFSGFDVRALQERAVQDGVLRAEVLDQQESVELDQARFARAASGDLHDAVNLAMLLREWSAAEERLLERLKSDPDDGQRLQAAAILGMFENRVGADLLVTALKGAEWGDGWNFRGMGQFGACLGPVDRHLLALVRCGHPAAPELVLEKLTQLEPDDALSHYRAAAECCEILALGEAGPALAKILSDPAIRGHAWTSSTRARDSVPEERNDTTTRNASLKELFIARALFRCGDDHGLGEQVLREYARDVRGTYALHAAAVLAETRAPVTEALGSMA